MGELGVYGGGLYGGGVYDGIDGMYGGVLLVGVDGGVGVYVGVGRYDGGVIMLDTSELGKVNMLDSFLLVLFFVCVGE